MPHMYVCVAVLQSICSYHLYPQRSHQILVIGMENVLSMGMQWLFWKTVCQLFTSIAIMDFVIVYWEMVPLIAVLLVGEDRTWKFLQTSYFSVASETKSTNSRVFFLIKLHQLLIKLVIVKPCQKIFKWNNFMVQKVHALKEVL